MKNSRNRTDARLVNKETKVIKTNLCASQTKSLDNDLVAIRKTKIKLMLKKPAYITIFILELRKYWRENSVMIRLNPNMTTNHDHFSQIQVI